MIAVMYNTIGITGVACVLIAYFMLQSGKLRPDGFPYLFLNLFGALFILFSLIYQWNLSAFIIQTSWVAISIYGTWKALFIKSKLKPY